MSHSDRQAPMRESRPSTESNAEHSKRGAPQVPDLERLADVLLSRDLSELEYEQDGLRIYLSRKREVEPAPAPLSYTVAAPASLLASAEKTTAEKVVPVAAPTKTDWSQHPGAVRSPMVGVAYVAPEPGAAPFVRVGDVVKSGQTLLIIEAMKVMNPIKASKDGRVAEIFVRDQDPVEYDEVLVVIE